MTLSQQELRMIARPALQHHGVMGMKWGKHKASRALKRDTKDASEKLDNSFAAKEAKLALQRKKEYHDRGSLSDAELQKRVNRLQTEQRYKELVDQPFKEAKNAVKEKRNNNLKRLGSFAAALPFAMINTGAGTGKYKVALSLLKYGVPAVTAAATGVAMSGGGKKKKKR